MRFFLLGLSTIALWGPIFIVSGIAPTLGVLYLGVGIVFLGAFLVLQHRANEAKS